MAVDEAVLEHVQAGTCPPTLRLFAWLPACLSLGQAQPFSDVDVTRLEERGWDVVRRLTGGRAILHTDELTYSVIANATEPRLTGSVLESYNRLARALLAAVKTLGLAVVMTEHKQETAKETNPVCFEVPSTYEITANSKKLIGSAQARRKAGVLQHGSLPLEGDLSRICQALAFPDESARRSAADRLLLRATTVESALVHKVDWQTAAQSFIKGFESALDLHLDPGELTDPESMRTDELVKEKYGHLSWTRRI
jgi:lipoate-protein ligase A